MAFIHQSPRRYLLGNSVARGAPPAPKDASTLVLCVYSEEHKMRFKCLLICGTSPTIGPGDWPSTEFPARMQKLAVEPRLCTKFLSADNFLGYRFYKPQHL